jgi:probable addiction module antidote protein
MINPPNAAVHLFEAKAFESNPAAAAAEAVARSLVMTEVARRPGLGRQSLYKALPRDGHPEFATVLSIVRALGLTLTIGQA